MAPSLTSLLTLSHDFRDSTAASAAPSFSNTEITTCLSLTTPLLECLDDELRSSVWSTRGVAHHSMCSKLNESLIGTPHPHQSLRVPPVPGAAQSVTDAPALASARNPAER